MSYVLGLVVKKTEEVWLEVSGERKVEGERWLDVGIFKGGIKAERIDVSEQGLLVWGDDERVVLRVKLEDKSGEVVVGGEIMAGAEMVVGNKVGVLVLKEKEIKVVGLDGEEIQSLDLEGVKGRLIEGYGRNVYLVADEDVFKFPGAESATGKRRRFLQAGAEVNTGQVMDMAIDGDLWLLERTGKVLRLSQGSVTDYQLKGVEEWKMPERVMVSEKMNRVWVWDKELGVIEFERETGNYLRKLVWDDFSRMTDMEVDEERKRLVGVKGSELWVVGLE